MIDFTKRIYCHNCGTTDKRNSWAIHLKYMDVLLCKKCIIDLRDSLDQLIKEDGGETMKYSQEETIKALMIIKETCESQGNDTYHSCPFGTNGGGCKITDDTPNEWNIVGNGVWRALQ